MGIFRHKQTLNHFPFIQLFKIPYREHTAVYSKLLHMLLIEKKKSNL